MKVRRCVILVSPAPVDGYPPVQSQARLLAGAGFGITIVTRALPGRQAVVFAHKGVEVLALAGTPKHTPGPASRLRRMRDYLAFVMMLARARVAGRGRIAVEIAYDPDGMWISDFAPFRQARRVAHFHETVMRLDSHWSERRLPRSMRHYQRIVVADAGRAEPLRKQLGLREAPITVPNFPVAEPQSPETPRRHPLFEVIFAGSLSSNHMVDLLIRSVPLWPEPARMVLLGDDSRPAAKRMKRLVQQLGLVGRVTFEGWIELPDLIPRLRRAHLAVSLLAPTHDQLILSVGASNKRYQYMQAGLPQIGDRLPGVPELIEGNRIGRCVREYSERAVAELVRYYLEHPQEREAAGRLAEQLHLERYNYQRAFAPMLEWIRKFE